MNVAAHRSSSATARPAVLLGLAAFMLALTLQELAVDTLAWLWSGKALLLVLVLGGFGVRYAGRRLSASTAGVILALIVLAAVLILR